MTDTYTKLQTFLEEGRALQNPEDVQTAEELYSDTVEAFCSYFRSVIGTDQIAVFYRGHTDADALRTKTMQADKRRSMDHESCIDAINIMNRFAKKNGMSCVCDTAGRDLEYSSVKDRQLAAKAVWEFCTESFLTQRPELKYMEPQV